jgi:hypothetical protein
MPDPEITPEILELILRTSRVKRCDGVYSLAPRGHRIGIYFQQSYAAPRVSARARAGLTQQLARLAAILRVQLMSEARGE